MATHTVFPFGFGKKLTMENRVLFVTEIKNISSDPSQKGEIILAEVFDKMLSDGKIIYGYELKGDWLECGDKLKWIKSFFHFSLKDPRYKEELKQYLKTIK